MLTSERITQGRGPTAGVIVYVGHQRVGAGSGRWNRVADTDGPSMAWPGGWAWAAA